MAEELVDSLNEGSKASADLTRRLKEVKQLANDLGIAVENINFQKLRTDIPLLDQVSSKLRELTSLARIKLSTPSLGARLKVDPKEIANVTQLLTQDQSIAQALEDSLTIQQDITAEVQKQINIGRNLREVIENTAVQEEEITTEKEKQLSSLKPATPSFLTGPATPLTPTPPAPLSPLLAGPATPLLSSSESTSIKETLQSLIPALETFKQALTVTVESINKEGTSVSSFFSKFTENTRSRIRGPQVQTAKGTTTASTPITPPEVITPPQAAVGTPNIVNRVLTKTKEQYTPDELKDLMTQVTSLAEKAGEKLDKVTLGKLKDEGPALQTMVDGFQTKLEKLSDPTATGLSSALQESVDRIVGMNDGAKKITGSLNKLVNISRDLELEQEGIIELSEKDLKKKLEAVKAERSNLEVYQKSLAIAVEKDRKVVEGLQQQLAAGKKLQPDQQKTLNTYQKNVAALKQADQALNNQSGTLKELQNSTEVRLKKEKQIAERLGLTGHAIEGITNALGKLGFKSKYFEDLDKKLKEIAKKSQELGEGKWIGRYRVAWEGVKGVIGGVLKALADPLFLMAGAVAGIKKLVEIGGHYSKHLAEIQTQYGLSLEASKELYHYNEVTALSLAKSRDISISDLATKKNIFEAQQQLNEAYGTTAVFSEDILADQTRLTQYLGLSGEEASKLSMYALQYNTTQNKLLQSIGKENKGLFSNKKILQEVLKVEGQLAANYKNNPELLAKAVVQTQKLGLSLQQAQSASKNLLNFEDSIQSEMEAELLLQKDLNLNEARYLAMQGKSAEAVESIMKQVGSLEDFQKLNVFQQEALAKAAGMTTDEFANSMVKQKQLNALTGQQKKVIDDLRKAGKNKEADELQALAGKKDEFDLANHRLSVQQRFNNTMEQLQDILSAILEGPMEKITRGMADWLPKLKAGMDSFLPKLKSAFVFVKDIVKGIASATSSFIGFLNKIGDIPILGDALKKLASIGGILLALRALGGFTKSLLLGPRGSSPLNPMFVQMSGSGAPGLPGVSGFNVGPRAGKAGRIAGVLGTGLDVLSTISSPKPSMPGPGTPMPSTIGAPSTPALSPLSSTVNAARATTLNNATRLQQASTMATQASTLARVSQVANVATGLAPFLLQAGGAGFINKGAEMKQAGQTGGQTVETVGQSMAQTGQKSMWTGMLEWGGSMLGKLNPLKIVPQLFAKFGGSLAGNVLKLLKALKGVKAISLILEPILAAGDIKAAMASGASDDDINQTIGKRVLQGLGGVLGGIGGASLIQSINFAVPGLGVALTPLAGIAGDFIGRSLFGVLADTVGARPIGQATRDVFGLEKPKSENALAGVEQQGTMPPIPEQSIGGVVTKTGIAKVDQGEVYLGKDTRETFIEMVKTLKEHTAILASIRDKELVVETDKLAYAVGRKTMQGYGNLLNPNSYV